MTLARPPLSIDAALARIAGQIPGDWEAMAKLTGYKKRTVQKWGGADVASDPAEARDMPIRAAITLDIEFQRAGGIGSPIYAAYGLLVESANVDAFGSKQELQRDTITFIKESSEAEIALLEASQPGAGAAEEAIAQREVLHLVQWGQRLLVKLGRKPP